jgi:hypothetical protein
MGACQGSMFLLQMATLNGPLQEHHDVFNTLQIEAFSINMGPCLFFPLATYI